MKVDSEGVNVHRMCYYHISDNDVLCSDKLRSIDDASTSCLSGMRLNELNVHRNCCCY